MLLHQSTLEAGLAALFANGGTVTDGRRNNRATNGFKKGNASQFKHSEETVALVLALHALGFTYAAIRAMTKGSIPGRTTALSYQTIENVLKGARYADTRAGELCRQRMEHYIRKFEPMCKAFPGYQPDLAVRDRSNERNRTAPAGMLYLPGQAEADEVERQIQARRAAAEARRDAGSAATVHPSKARVQQAFGLTQTPTQGPTHAR